MEAPFVIVSLIALRTGEATFFETAFFIIVFFGVVFFVVAEEPCCLRTGMELK
jgi:hypothetical protein